MGSKGLWPLVEVQEAKPPGGARGNAPLPRPAGLPPAAPLSCGRWPGKETAWNCRQWTRS
ncbi:Adenylate cyclase [Rhodovastum atsumiense]|nr:Adenylate cyclase [Rhodovastum atsumiense]